MLKIGKIIPPSKEMVTICLEEFASSGFRDTFETTVLSGDLQGKYVLKKYRSDQLPPLEELFGSMEIHTSKAVQMHCLARNFAKSLENECPLEYGDMFKYNKVYYGKMGSECITPENEMILFCYGNLSTLAINAFVGMHKCNKYCKQLKLESF